MKRRTKIVCTLGPAVDDRQAIKDLIDAGMNVARLNCSHGDWEAKRRWIAWIRELEPSIGPIGILADLQGPKFRIGDVAGGSIELKRGDAVTLGDSTDASIPVHADEILRAFAVGDRILMGDGEIEIRISEGQRPLFTGTVVCGGALKSRKGITLVGKSFQSTALTTQDIQDVNEAVAAGVDYIALSYIRSASDVRALRHIVDTLDPTLQICAKIETPEAVDDLADILKVSDFIMVARGDMGLQMDIEDVPLTQKFIIDQCLRAGRPVITATQMLESMIENPRPTRAEATDVANAVLDGTDAVMLSGETAAGKYPIECVKTMERIALAAEKRYDRVKIERIFQEQAHKDISNTDAIAHSVSDLAKLLCPSAIVTTTTSGQTPRLVSRFRPLAPVLCATWNPRTFRQLAVVWGVESVMIDGPKSTDENLKMAIDEFYRHRRVALGDCVVMTAGVPAGQPGHTNMIMTHVVK